jgi:hypothetical protein
MADSTIAELIQGAGDAARRLPTYSDIMDKRAAVQLRQQQLAEHNAAYAREEGDRQRMQTLGSLAAGGDYAGAQKGALQAGDLSGAGKFAEMGKEVETQKIARARQKIKDGASLIFDVRANYADPAQRKQAIEMNRGALRERGYTDAEIDTIPTDDAGMGVFLGNAQTYDEKLAAAEKEAARRTQERGQDVTDRGNYLQAGLFPPGAPGTGITGGGGPASSGSSQIPFDRLIGAESGGNHFNSSGGVTTSPKGALGIAQLMPGTAPEAARLAGVAYDPNRVRTDPNYNRQLGEAYYNSLRQQFGDDRLAAAAYNAGPRRVRAALAKGGPDGWLNHVPAETRDYVAKVTGGQSANAAPRTIGGLQIIPGGKLDKRNGPDAQKLSKESKRDTVTLRKEFDALPEVKNFKTIRTAVRQIESLTSNPKATAQDDIAAIFSFMRALDPTSVVRDTEFATAQNATGIPERIRNLYNQALAGNRLNPQQRLEMRNTAARMYTPVRDAYNETAQTYRGYARDLGVDPGAVALTAVPNAPQKATTLPQGVTIKRVR